MILNSFVLQSMRRVKANDKISFPAALDMSPFLAGETSAPTSQPAPDSQASIPEDPALQQYELAAILVHKGGSATQGHYGEPSSVCVYTTHPFSRLACGLATPCA